MGEARRLRANLVQLISFCAVFFVLPASAANWTVQAEPTLLVNGGPVLFRVKPPVKIESLTAVWLGHQFAFSYEASTKTWFALAGTNLDTSPGTYPLELTATSSTATSRSGKTPLTLTRRFAVVD